MAQDGRTYYSNTKSGEVSWTLPEGANLASSSEQSPESVPNTLNPVSEQQWQKHVAQDGRTYYSNTKSGEVSWTLPKGANLVKVVDRERRLSLLMQKV